MAEPSATDTALAQDINGLKIKEGKCYFTSIEPEIRNYIYELVFTSDSDTNLFTATPPSKALCLTSRKIYEETYAMYRSMFRAFWTTTRFDLDLRGLTEEDEVREARAKLRTVLDGMRDEDIAHIQTMRAWDTGCDDIPNEWQLRADGVWNLVDSIDLFPGLVARFPRLVEEAPRDWFFFDSAYKNALKKAGFDLFVPIGMKNYWCAADFDIKDLPRVKQLAHKDSPTKDELVAVVRMLTRFIIEGENDDFTQEEIGASVWARWQGTGDWI